MYKSYTHLLENKVSEINKQNMLIVFVMTASKEQCHDVRYKFIFQILKLKT